MNAVSDILGRIEAGEQHASQELLPLVYDELRKLAAHKLAQEQPGHSLQATALVHEAYMRLVKGSSAGDWDGRGHFFSAAAEAMRRILVEQARRKEALKRGGGQIRHDLSELGLAESGAVEDVLAVSEALDQLAEADPTAAELVKLRFFAGLTGREAAAALDLPPRTADRTWAYARSFLYCQLHHPDEA